MGAAGREVEFFFEAGDILDLRFGITYVSYNRYIHKVMKKSAKMLWEDQIGGLWPALKGSLNQVAKPCIRPNCAACRAGTKHPAWLLAYSQEGKRRCLYVPQDMVATIKLALKNGRRLEKLLFKMGPALIGDHRQSVKSKKNTPTKS